MTEISIRAEEIFRIGGWPVTNAVLLSTVAVLLLAAGALLLRLRLALLPARLQAVAELFLDGTLGIMDAVLGSRALSEKYLPLVATIFLFVLTSNWLGLFPGVGPIGIVPPAPEIGHGSIQLIPLFRAPASDLNFTIALAVISVLAVNLLGVVAIGAGKHFGKFFNVRSPLELFTGCLEFISELVKIVSFSFRLFGNVFAGEVLLVVVTFLVPYLIPLPFLFLEIFVGFIQALIFAMLTLVFTAMAVLGHDREPSVEHQKA